MKNENNNPQNLLCKIFKLSQAVKEKLGTLLLEKTSVISVVQQNQPELLTKLVNSFFEATFDHMLLEGSSFFVTPCFNSPKGTNRLWNKDAIAPAFKDANGNYIFCPTQHDLVANVTPMTSSRSTIKDKIKVLAHLVIWSCISQHCYYSITLALIMTSKRIKHHHNGFQFEQGEITEDCIWHWLQCLTKCVMCTANLTYHKMYTIPRQHAGLVFALQFALVDSCTTFFRMGVNPVGPIFNINPHDVLSSKMVETSCLKEDPLLLMTMTYILWCTRRLKDEVGIVRTTDHLQTMAESLSLSSKKSEHVFTIAYFTENFLSIHAKEKLSLCMVSEQQIPKPEMSKRGNLPIPYPEASALNANKHSPHFKPALTTYEKALTNEKVLSTPTGLVQQGPRGRGRGRKALWGDENALLECRKEQWMLGRGCRLGSNTTGEITESSVLLTAEAGESAKTEPKEAGQTPTCKKSRVVR